jgi:hypothetical protein
MPTSCAIIAVSICLPWTAAQGEVQSSSIGQSIVFKYDRASVEIWRDSDNLTSVDWSKSTRACQDDVCVSYRRTNLVGPGQSDSTFLFPRIGCDFALRVVVRAETNEARDSLIDKLAFIPPTAQTHPYKFINFSSLTQQSPPMTREERFSSSTVAPQHCGD